MGCSALRQLTRGRAISMATRKNIALRKRQKIQDSNKTMFAWIAGMSALVGLSLVVSWFLFQQLTFRTEVIGAKNDTLSTLKENNSIADELISNVRKYEANAALNSSKTDADDRTLQVILDALPSDANSLALGASLQEKLAAGISGLTIESLKVDSAAAEKGSSATKIPFKMTVKADNADNLKDLLFRFERSIRTISIDNLTLERSSSEYTMTIDGHAYYEPAASLNLTEKTVKP